jgi:hypothetical protein
VNDNIPRQGIPAPLGSVEPHAPMLIAPPDGQLLYKMMTIENLLRSISSGYLHFNRVDSYADFPGADKHDGKQLPRDQPGNATVRFEKAPDFSAADYYDQARVRTYACCLSLENSQFIWDNYANSSTKGKVCIVFDFAKFRSTLNRTFEPGNAALEYNGKQCRQIFSINYSIVEYVQWDEHQASASRLPNRITYSYLNDKRFSGEKELRITLSTLGVGQFVMNDGSTIEFPTSLHAAFDFRAAIADGTIHRILCASDCDCDFFRAELLKLGIRPAPGSDVDFTTGRITDPDSPPDPQRQRAGDSEADT